MARRIASEIGAVAEPTQTSPDFRRYALRRGADVVMKDAGVTPAALAWVLSEVTVPDAIASDVDPKPYESSCGTSSRICDISRPRSGARFG